MAKKKNVCCICGKTIEGWGNNPWPIKEEGELFSCCAPSLDEARRRRDVWLTKR